MIFLCIIFVLCLDAHLDSLSSLCVEGLTPITTIWPLFFVCTACNNFTSDALVEDRSCTACDGPNTVNCRIATCTTKGHYFRGGTCIGLSWLHWHIRNHINSTLWKSHPDRYMYLLLNILAQHAAILILQRMIRSRTRAALYVTGRILLTVKRLPVPLDTTPLALDLAQVFARALDDSFFTPYLTGRH